MKYFLFFLIISISTFKPCYSQKDKTLNTQKIIQDALSSIIKEIVKRPSSNATYNFENSGFLSVRLERYNNDAFGKEVKFVFDVKDQYYNLEKLSENSNLKPSRFELINDKIVLFFLPYTRISEANEDDLKGLIKNKLNLEKIEGKLGGGYNQVFTIHGGYTLEIYGDGTYKYFLNN